MSCVCIASDVQTGRLLADGLERYGIKLVKEVQISDSVIGDMFLTFAKKLGQPAPVRKPAEKDQKLNNTLGRSLNFNSTLGRSIPKRQESIEESIVES